MLNTDMFLNEIEATILGLVAQNPVANRRLLRKLNGPALQIGRLITGVGAASNDPSVIEAANAMLEWAGRSAPTVSSNSGLRQPQAVR